MFSFFFFYLHSKSIHPQNTDSSQNLVPPQSCPTKGQSKLQILSKLLLSDTNLDEGLFWMQEEAGKLPHHSHGYLVRAPDQKNLGLRQDLEASM